MSETDDGIGDKNWDVEELLKTQSSILGHACLPRMPRTVQP